MDKATLVDKRTEDGKRLVRALDEAGFPVSSALWYYLTEPAEWRLVIASPVVRERGPDAAYKSVQAVLGELRDVSLELGDIWVVKDTDGLIQLLRRAVTTPPGAVADIRFTRGAVGGVFIEDAHIYRST